MVLSMLDHKVAEKLSVLLFTNPGKISFFIGAGCSRSAGIPIANEIIKDLTEKLYLKESNNEFRRKEDQCHVDEERLRKWLDSQKWYDPQNPYSSILDRSFSGNKERCIFFEQMINERKPTATHIGLASIIKNGLSNIVLTPNFDRLIEHAIIHVCQRVPAVWLYDSDPRYINLELPRPKILKLHGDYLYGNIRNLEHELSTVKRSMSAKLQKASFKRGIIVCGYSGSDNTIMESLERLSSDKNNFEMGIHWLIRKNSEPNQRVLALIEKTKDRGSCIYKIDGSDSFFIELSQATEKRTRLGSVSMLDGKAHINALDEKGKKEMASKYLDEEDLSKFIWLEENEVVPGMADTMLSFDYLMSRYEELGDIPNNLSEYIERYADYLLNGWLYGQSPGYSYPEIQRQLVNVYSNFTVGNEFEHNLNSISPDISIQMLNMIISSGLVKNVRENLYSFNASFSYYLKALSLKEKNKDSQTLLTFLDEDKFLILCYYVGMIDDASNFIAEVADFKMTTRRQSLIGPWPREFYLAAELTGRAHYVDLGIAKSISNRLLLDLDREKNFQYEAVRALSRMKGMVTEQTVEQLVSYMGDLKQDTFSREDAAKALGKIGTRCVVDRLGKCLNNWPPEAKNMAVFALGLTSNPRAVKVIKTHWEEIPHESRWVAEDALKSLGCFDIPIEQKIPCKKAGSTPTLSITDMLEKALRDPVSREILGDDYDRSKFIIYRKYLPEIYGQSELSQFLPSVVMSEMVKLMRLGDHYRISGQYDYAESIYQELIEGYPMIVEGYHHLALVYSAQDRLSNAERYYELGMRLKPSYADYYNDFGVLLIKTGKMSAARRTLQIASMINPSDHRPWLNIGLINLNEGRIGDAYKCFKKCLYNKPDHEKAEQFIRDLRGDLSETDIQLLDYDLKNNVNQDYLWGMESFGRPQSYDDIVSRGKYYLWKEASIKQQAGDLQGAYDAFDKLQKVFPDNVDILHNMAVIKEKEKKILEAVNLYKKILSIEPINHDANVNLCNIYLNNGNIVDAKSHASKALVGLPDSLLAKYYLAKCLYRECKKIESLDILKEALKDAEPSSKIESRIRNLITEIEGHK